MASTCSQNALMARRYCRLVPACRPAAAASSTHSSASSAASVSHSKAVGSSATAAIAPLPSVETTSRTPTRRCAGSRELEVGKSPLCSPLRGMNVLLKIQQMTGNGDVRSAAGCGPLTEGIVDLPHGVL